MIEKIATIPAGSEGHDFSGWRPTIAELRRIRCSYVLRYVALGGAWKRASVAEIQSYLDAGIAVILIVEEAADSWTAGYSKGFAHGKRSAEVVEAFGYPHGLPIVPAWDTNVAAGDQRALGYGNGFADAIEPRGYRLGLYSDLDVIRMLNHRSVFNWLAGATSWSDGSKPYQPETQPDYGLVHVRQVISGSTPNYDRNITLRPFQAWLPHTVQTPAPPAPPIPPPAPTRPAPPPRDEPEAQPPPPSSKPHQQEDDMDFFTHSENREGRPPGFLFFALMPDGTKRHVTGLELDTIRRVDRAACPALTNAEIDSIPDYVPPTSASSVAAGEPPTRFTVTLSGTAQA